MNPHHLNGERLLQQGRAKEAIEAFRKALADDPNNGHTHALHALALMDVKDLSAALGSAREAVRLEPGQPFAHYVTGLVHLVKNNLIDAERAANQAVQLDPNNAEYFRLLALVKISQKQFPEALRLVDHALSIDPENTECLNLRSQVLIQLRRTGEARDTAGQALASSPDSAHSHANAGWTALHNNKTKEALGHFKESLRLEPGNAWAKAGLAEALKARNPVYRLLLIFFLWMNRLDGRTQFFLILGGWLVVRAMRSVSNEVPELAPVLMPLIVLYFVFVALTWVGQPLFDLTLLLSPYGRNALDSLQRWSATAFGLFVAAALICCGVAIAGGPGAFYGWAVVAGVSAITVSRTIAEDERWRRVAFGVCAAVILLLGGAAVLALMVKGENNPVTVGGAIASGIAFMVFMWLPAVSSLKR